MMELQVQSSGKNNSLKAAGGRACLAPVLKNCSTLALNRNTVNIYLRTVLISGTEITT